MVSITRGFALLVLLIFFVSSVSASFTKGSPGYSIENSYGPGSIISGWINLSLSNEPTNSILKDSYGEEIGLMDLIKKTSNTGFLYTCNPVSCVSDYVASGEATSKTISLNENQTVIIGFNISRKELLTDVSGFSFNLTSNNPETEKLPLILDLLNDGQDEWTAYQPSSSYGNENFGCFLIATSSANLVQTPYCERVSLLKSPEVEIGAYVLYAQGNKNVPFTMSIKRVDSGESRSCEADATDTGRISCSALNFPIKENGDYYVCVQAKNSVDANSYQINFEQNNPCGYTGNFEGTYTYDFEIFARSKTYASGINFTLNNDELSASTSPVNDVEGYIRNYIMTAYNGNCSRDCIIPLKIFSGIQQQITVSGAIITYLAGIASTTNKIYDVQETPAKISSAFQRLYLGEAGFHVPTDYGDNNLSISLAGNDVIVSQPIMIETIPIIKSLTPTSTGVKYPTKFKIILNESMNITEYNWDFGDGGKQISSTSSITYTYENTSQYTMKITLIDDKGMNSSKEFVITVEPISQIIPTLLSDTKTNVAYIESQLPTFSAFEQKAISDSLGLEGIKANLTRLENASSTANSEAEFEAILGELLELKIPLTVSKTTYSEGLSFYTEGNNIDLGLIKKIGGGDYDTTKESKYKESVMAWDAANTNTVMIYSEISAIYGDYEEPFLKTFDITVSNTAGNAYLVIKDMKDLLFDQDYSQKKQDGYYYISLDSPEKHIVFSTTDSVDFSNVPMFISPPLSELSLVEWTPFTETGELKKWILFSVVVIIILIIAAVIWIILKFWYKKKYEAHLFKNRNNLYNLMNYIQGEKGKGTKEKDIAVKLRKVGWNAEQVGYALKKHAGKKIGMPEINLGKKLPDSKLTDNKNANNFMKK